MLLAAVPVSGLKMGCYLRGYFGETGMTGGTGIPIPRRLSAALVIRATVRFLCVKSGALILGCMY